MTNKEDYQKLKETIQKANPEIMELKFGCKIRTFQSTNDKRRKKPFETVVQISGEAGDRNNPLCVFTTESLSGKSYDVLDNGEKSYRKYHSNMFFWVFGRPITLVDVLFTLKEENKKNNDGRWDMVFHDNRSHQDYIGISEWTFSGFGKTFYWNLKQNSLDWHYKNKPETVEFLIDLLVKQNKCKSCGEIKTCRCGETVNEPYSGFDAVA